ncbi:hypothetical protein N7478_012169 [Penicillium angulare]|uniref:uncharacterized protein n=1 Tax=Penicillium angulare TaxID=116970 RepID=UPI002541EE1A|nr:uncharacterized protein N7478_012169 [Penicillium angulare]KAJ5260564.1 hypothetical protein N7478_012169 [Penicillium angulare]
MLSIFRNPSLWLAASAIPVGAQYAPVQAAPSPAPTSGGGSCASQSLVDQCVATMGHSLAKCTEDDWDCKCSGSANIANCYVDCPDDPARFSAELVSEQDCATANAYDKGQTSVAATWTTPGPDKVVATPTDDLAFETPTSQPTKTLNEANKGSSPSEGVAAMNLVTSWLPLLGFGFGIMI